MKRKIKKQSKDWLFSGNIQRVVYILANQLRDFVINQL